MHAAREQCERRRRKGGKGEEGWERKGARGDSRPTYAQDGRVTRDITRWKEMWAAHRGDGGWGKEVTDNADGTGVRPPSQTKWTDRKNCKAKTDE